MRKLHSLKVKIPFFTMIIVTIMTIVLVTLIINAGSKGIRTASIFGFESSAKIYSRMITTWLEQSIIISEVIASSYSDVKDFLSLKTPDLKDKSEIIIKNIIKSNPSIQGIIILDSEGKAILDSEDGSTINSPDTRLLSGTPVWQNIMSGKSAVNNTVEFLPGNQEIVVMKIFSPIKSDASQIIGAICTMFDWHDFIDKELTIVKFGKTGHPFIVDQDSWVIADPIPSHIRNETIKNADYIKYAREHNEGYLEFNSPFNGRASVSTFYREPISDWSIVMSIESSELFSQIAMMKMYAIIGTTLMIVLTSLFIIFYIHKITVILHLLSNDLNRLSNGNLTLKVSGKFLSRKDEFGEIAHSFKDILDRLNEKVNVVYESAYMVKSSANEVVQGSSDLSNRTENQASSLEETASSMEEISSTIKSSTEHTLEGNNMMINSRNSIEEAGRIIEKTTQNIESVYEASVKISDITKIIEKIAFQTNILALNAAVEAARAGEQGKGFAVVASEVRNLAQTTQTSVKDITTLITDSEEKIATATETARESKEIFQNLRLQVEETAKIMQDLSSTAMEQQAGVDQVNLAINQIDMITQQNAALVEETTASCEALSVQAEELVTAMGFFKLKGSNENSNTTKVAEEKNGVKESKNRELKSPIKNNTTKSSPELKSPIKNTDSQISKPELKSPIKKHYEEKIPNINNTPKKVKDSEFGTTFDVSKDASDGFETF